MSSKLTNVVRLRARGNLRDNINAVVISISVAQLGGEGWEAFPALFGKKKVLYFRKKGPHCVHPYIKFTIQNFKSI